MTAKFICESFVDEVCILLILSNLLVISTLIIKRKQIPIEIISLIIIYNLSSMADSLLGVLNLYFNVNTNLEISQYNFEVLQWLIFLLFYYKTERKQKLKKIYKFLLYFIFIYLITIAFINHYYQDFILRYILHGFFLTILPIALIRFFEHPSSNKTYKNFHSPEFYINCGIAIFLLSNFCSFLFGGTIHINYIEVSYVLVIIVWLSFFVFQAFVLKGLLTYKLPFQSID